MEAGPSAPGGGDDYQVIDDLAGDGPAPLSSDDDDGSFGGSDGGEAPMDVEDESIHSFEGHTGERGLRRGGGRQWAAGGGGRSAAQEVAHVAPVGARRRGARGSVEPGASRPRRDGRPGRQGLHMAGALLLTGHFAHACVRPGRAGRPPAAAPPQEGHPRGHPKACWAHPQLLRPRLASLRRSGKMRWRRRQARSGRSSWQATPTPWLPLGSTRGGHCWRQAAWTVRALNTCARRTPSACT
jgi:hypothetical protein